MRRLLAVCATAFAAVAQSPLTTTFVHDNGGAVGGALYFDLTVLPAAGITVTGLELNVSGAGSIGVFRTPTTRVGAQTTVAAWTLIGSGAVVGATAGAATPVAIAPFVLPAGAHGIAIVGFGVAHHYTDGNGSNQNHTTAELALAAGEATNVPFAAPLLAPRVVNARLHYVPGANHVVATNTPTGHGCLARFASAYEWFTPASAFDLANSALRFTPAAGGGYNVTRAGALLPVGATAAPVVLPLTDDAEITVPFTVGAFPGWSGVTVCSNGSIARATGNGVGFTPSAPALLAAPQDAFWSWHDFDPGAAGSGPVVLEESAALTVVTWNGVHDHLHAVPNTLQFQLAANGVVTLAWGAMSGLGNDHVVGWSPGGASADPGPRDWSALGAGAVVLTPQDVPALALAAVSRPVLGTTWSLALANVPPTAVLGVDVFGYGDPLIDDLATLGAPGCGLRATLDAVLAWTPTSATHGYGLPLPNNLALLGVHVHTTSAVFQVPPVNAFGAITANGIDGRIGDL
jgi:hypothetical protein